MKQKMNKNTKQATVTIGIPAYNEEANIVHLLQSIVGQKNENYHIERIIVNSDGSSDNTIKKVHNFSKKHAIVTIKDNKDRKGKAHRLNELYAMTNSDYLLTIDADVVLANNFSIESMLQTLQHNKSIMVTAPRQIPVQPKEGFMEKVLYYNYLLWNQTKETYNNGNNFYTVTGSACMMKKAFYKKIKFPTSIVCDQGYVYIQAKKKDGYMFSPNAAIKQTPTTTWHDMRLAYSRSKNERKELTSIIDENTLSLYEHLPVLHKLKTLASAIVSNPFYMSSAILANLVLQFVMYDDVLLQNGMWATTASTKKGII
jgi:glycosyltransferase involved in cell wall biosynthesis